MKKASFVLDLLEQRSPSTHVANFVFQSAGNSGNSDLAAVPIRKDVPEPQQSPKEGGG